MRFEEKMNSERGVCKSRIAVISAVSWFVGGSTTTFSIVVVGARKWSALLAMNSQYDYVRRAELSDVLLPSTYLLCRLDGKAFHHFSTHHHFLRPNDQTALELMNAAARRLLGAKELNGQCVLAFGESDEFSFLFLPSCTLYNRRQACVSPSRDCTS